MSRSQESTTHDMEAMQVVSTDGDSEMAHLSNNASSTKSCHQQITVRLCAFWLLSVVTAVILAVIIVFTKTNDLQNQINDLKAELNRVEGVALAGHGDEVTVLGFSTACAAQSSHQSSVVGSSVTLSCFTQSQWSSNLTSAAAAKVPFTVPVSGLYQIVITGPYFLSNAVNVSTESAVDLSLLVSGNQLLLSESNENDLRLQSFVPLLEGNVLSVKVTHNFIGSIAYGVEDDLLTFSLIRSGQISQS